MKQLFFLLHYIEKPLNVTMSKFYKLVWRINPSLDLSETLRKQAEVLSYLCSRLVHVEGMAQLVTVIKINISKKSQLLWDFFKAKDIQYHYSQDIRPSLFT